MSLRILVVDDEPKIYQAFKRVLWTSHPDWEIHYANDGTQGLTFLHSKPVDVIISDYKMPMMDGATFLTYVSDNFPWILRLVLTGQCEQEAAYKLVKTSHLFLQKPADTENLIAYLERMLKLKVFMHNEDLIKIAHSVNTLPSRMCTESPVQELLKKDDVTSEDLLRVIAEDPSLMTKILQMANSSYFNQASQVTQLANAINSIGIDAIRTLVLKHDLLHEFQVKEIVGFDVCLMGQEIITCAQFARYMAIADNKDQRFADEVYVASVLSKIGIIFTASTARNLMELVIQKALQEKISYRKAEVQVYGCTHANIGAYFLAIWGLPDRLVDVVQCYINPVQCGDYSSDSLLAYVHIASHLFSKKTQLKPNIFDTFEVEGSESFDRPKYEQLFDKFCHGRVQKKAV